MKMKSDLIESVQPMFYFYSDLDKLWPWSFGTEHEKCPKNKKIKFQDTNCKNLILNISVRISELRAN